MDSDEVGPAVPAKRSSADPGGHDDEADVGELTGQRGNESTRYVSGPPERPGFRKSALRATVRISVGTGGRLGSRAVGYLDWHEQPGYY